MAVIVGGDGYASHYDCDPEDAVPGCTSPEGDICWICNEPLED